MSDVNWDEALQGQEELGDDDFPQLPEQTFDMEVEEAKVTVSKSGNDMIDITLFVTEDGPWKNRKLHVYPLFVPSNAQQMKNTFRTLEAFGIDKAYIAKHKPSKEQIAEMVVGRDVRAVVVHDNTYMPPGETVARKGNQIKKLLPPTGANPAIGPPSASASPGPGPGPRTGGGGSGPGVPNVPAPQEQAAAAPPPPVPVPDAGTSAPAVDESEPF